MRPDHLLITVPLEQQQHQYNHKNNHKNNNDDASKLGVHVRCQGARMCLGPGGVFLAFCRSSRRQQKNFVVVY